MDTVTTYNETCPFCGRILTHKVRSEDGYDWEGHKRGSPSATVHKQTCSCAFGALVETMPHVKNMCLNCISCENGSCTSKLHLQEMSKMMENFEICTDQFRIKDAKGSCSHHQLDNKIFCKLFAEEKPHK